MKFQRHAGHWQNLYPIAGTVSVAEQEAVLEPTSNLVHASTEEPGLFPDLERSEGNFPALEALTPKEGNSDFEQDDLPPPAYKPHVAAFGSTSGHQASIGEENAFTRYAIGRSIGSSERSSRKNRP